MTLQKAFNPWDDIDRLYVSGKEEERKLSFIEEYINAKLQGLTSVSTLGHTAKK